MIHYEHFTLSNGLQVYVHQDHSTPMRRSILSTTSARRTNFAHLFEHLIFGSSKHVPVYDEPLQEVNVSIFWKSQ
ncbi:MAG: hypothetical protein EAZ32_04910 [Cytophagia bacterium]|nr:MAG: hypothetical protein EAZ38_07330 [Cytophagales bacterium]TAG40902.1 MAG: hypothetical protein EAZ32_04910 [Cytophagia bacterium]TAG71739.1 MAG: hypothetical protein EAZ26_04845 [Runella slithyformis]TAG82563.1 MAG: hypothetical protein EAZ22_05030 [Cytophagales bacterium]